MKPKQYGETGRPRQLAVTAALYLLIAMAPPASASGSGVHGRVLALDESGKITGTVPGAKIELKDASGVGVAEVTSAEGGYYRVDLPPGQYFYKVTADDFKDEDRGRGITLQLSEGYALYNFSLTKGPNDPNRKPPTIPHVEVGKLEGRVLEATRDGRQVGIANAKISLRPDDGRELSQVISGGPSKAGEPSGQYEVVLKAGSWRASISAEGFQTMVDPQPIPIEAGKDATRNFLLTRVAPEVPSGQGIQGVVSVRTPQGESLAPVQIQMFIVPLTGHAEPSDPLSPDPRGRYSRDLNVGRYRVFAAADGYQTARSGPTDVFAGKYSVVDLTLVPEIDRGTPAVPEDMPTAPELVFKGTVLELGPRGTIKVPLAGAGLLIRQSGQPLDESPRGTTNEEGKVELKVSQPGEYTVLAQKPGYEPGGARVNISSGGENIAVITLMKKQEQLRPTDRPITPPDEAESVTVTGFVVYRNEASATGLFGLQGAKLMWRPFAAPMSQVKQVVAGNVGSFTIELREGDYEVDAYPPPGSERRFLGASEKLAVRVGMPPKYFFLERTAATTPPEEGPPNDSAPVDVRGYVVTRSATSSTGYASVANAEIRFTAGATGMTVMTTRSDRAGRFSILLPQDTYNAYVQATPYRDLNERVQVRPGMENQFFVMQRTGGPAPPEATMPENAPPGEAATLNLRVLERVSVRLTRPVSGAEVVVAQGLRRVAVGRSDEQGSCLLRVPPGSYQLWVRSQGHEVGRDTVALTAGIVSRDIYLTPSRQQQQPQGPATLSLSIVGVDPRGGKRGQPAYTYPLVGARISITQNRRNVASGQTDKAGTFSTRLQPGNYQVDVNHQGFAPAREIVTVTLGTVSRKITLNPSSATVPGPKMEILPGLPIPPRRPDIEQDPDNQMRSPGLRGPGMRVQ